MHKVFVIKLPVEAPKPPNEIIELSRIPCEGEYIHYPGSPEWVLVKAVVHCADEKPEDREYEAEIFVEKVNHLGKIGEVNKESFKKLNEVMEKLLADKKKGKF